MPQIELHQSTEISSNLVQHDFFNPGFSWKIGQYCVLSLSSEEKLYLAIASHPSEKTLKFIVPKTSKLSEHLSKTEPVYCDAPAGNGFNHDLFNHPTVIAISHGTGISAIRPVLLQAQKKNKPPVLFYGCKDESEYPTGTEYSEVSPLIAYSKSAQKHVQDLITEYSFSEPGKIGVFLVGSNEFQDSVTDELIKKGFAKEHISKNF